MKGGAVIVIEDGQSILIRVGGSGGVPGGDCRPSRSCTAAAGSGGKCSCCCDEPLQEQRGGGWWREATILSGKSSPDNGSSSGPLWARWKHHCGGGCRCHLLPRGGDDTALTTRSEDDDGDGDDGDHQHHVLLVDRPFVVQRVTNSSCSRQHPAQPRRRRSLCDEVLVQQQQYGVNYYRQGRVCVDGGSAASSSSDGGDGGGPLLIDVSFYGDDDGAVLERVPCTALRDPLHWALLTADERGGVTLLAELFEDKRHANDVAALVAQCASYFDHDHDGVLNHEQFAALMRATNSRAGVDNGANEEGKSPVVAPSLRIGRNTPALAPLDRDLMSLSTQHRTAGGAARADELSDRKFHSSLAAQGTPTSMIRRVKTLAHLRNTGALSPQGLARAERAVFFGERRGGELPRGWEARQSPDNGREFFVDHNGHITWQLPNAKSLDVQRRNQNTLLHCFHGVGGTPPLPPISEAEFQQLLRNLDIGIHVGGLPLEQVVEAWARTKTGPTLSQRVSTLMLVNCVSGEESGSGEDGGAPSLLLTRLAQQRPSSSCSSSAAGIVAAVLEAVAECPHVVVAAAHSVYSTGSRAEWWRSEIVRVAHCQLCDGGGEEEATTAALCTENYHRQINAHRATRLILCNMAGLVSGYMEHAVRDGADIARSSIDLLVGTFAVNWHHSSSNNAPDDDDDDDGVGRHLDAVARDVGTSLGQYLSSSCIESLCRELCDFAHVIHQPTALRARVIHTTLRIVARFSDAHCRFDEVAATDARNGLIVAAHLPPYRGPAPTTSDRDTEGGDNVAGAEDKSRRQEPPVFAVQAWIKSSCISSSSKKKNWAAACDGRYFKRDAVEKGDDEVVAVPVPKQRRVDRIRRLLRRSVSSEPLFSVVARSKHVSVFHDDIIRHWDILGELDVRVWQCFWRATIANFFGPEAALRLDALEATCAHFGIERVEKHFTDGLRPDLARLRHCLIQHLEGPDVYLESEATHRGGFGHLEVDPCPFTCHFTFEATETGEQQQRVTISDNDAISNLVRLNMSPRIANRVAVRHQLRALHGRRVHLPTVMFVTRRVKEGVGSDGNPLFTTVTVLLNFPGGRFECHNDRTEGPALNRFDPRVHLDNGVGTATSPRTGAILAFSGEKAVLGAAALEIYDDMSPSPKLTELITHPGNRFEIEHRLPAVLASQQRRRDETNAKRAADERLVPSGFWVFVFMKSLTSRRTIEGLWRACSAASCAQLSARKSFFEANAGAESPETLQCAHFALFLPCPRSHLKPLVRDEAPIALTHNLQAVAQGLDFLFERLKFVFSHTCAAAWHLFWCDLWTSNHKMMQHVEAKLFDPGHCTSICYIPKSREQLLTFLHSTCLRGGGCFVANSPFHDRVVDTLYELLSAAASEACASGSVWQTARFSVWREDCRQFDKRRKQTAQRAKRRHQQQTKPSPKRTTDMHTKTANSIAGKTKIVLKKAKKMSIVTDDKQKRPTHEKGKRGKVKKRAPVRRSSKQAAATKRKTKSLAKTSSGDASGSSAEPITGSGSRSANRKEKK